MNKWLSVFTSMGQRVGFSFGSARSKRTGKRELLRAELLSLEQLRDSARRLAHSHQVETRLGPNQLLTRLDANAISLKQSHEVLLAADAAGHRISPAEEWILDNFYLVEQQIELAAIHLPRSYSHRLPRLTQGVFSGLPRVYGLAAHLISHLDGLLDAEAIVGFIGAYQSVTPLNLGELWAVPISLRLALIENLRCGAELLAQRRRDMSDGQTWAERMLDTAERDPRSLIRLLADFAEAHPALSAPFLAEFTNRLQNQSDGASVAIALSWVDQTLSEASTTVTQELHKDSHNQAAEHLSITNSIASIRFLDATDWKSFVEEQSRVEQILRLDPARAYPAQDFATRDHYRHIVESLAAQSGRDEAEVAQMALETASMARTEPGCDRKRHVGAYLVGGERFMFRKLVGCPWTIRFGISQLMRRYRLLFYLLAIGGGTLAVAFLPPWFCGMALGEWRFWVVMLAAALPASMLSISLVNYMVTLRVAPHPLPRLDFSRGIPAEHTTMVAVPTLLTSRKAVQQLLERLEIHYLANRDRHLQFALLTDFPDAESETLPTDAVLLRQAEAGITNLNERYPRPEGEPAPFHLLHRPRVWNPHEKVWMGYERKRGKLSHFNALLKGKGRQNFSVVVGDQEVLARVRYVITLDSDTDLPRGAANTLVGAMAHPLNRAKYDPARGRVVDGYAILQPRVSIRLESAQTTLYARLAHGVAGFDPYSREVSDVYQDLFSEGAFVGKGIYDVEAFQRALEHRFPENLILSHDLIESCYARSGLLGCVEVYEDAPASYLGEVSRQHRWMRGDWQLLRWLGKRPPTVCESRQQCQPVTLLGQWKIFDNMRRGLFAPSLLILLLIGWVKGGVSAGCWTLFALSVLGLTGIVRSATLLLRKPRERGMRLHLNTWARRCARYSLQPLFMISMLPYEAVVALCALVRSGLRFPFTKKGLLCWHLPLYRRLQSRTTPGGFVMEMWSAPLVAVLSAALCATLRPASLPAALPVATLWFFAPLIAWFVSKPLASPTPRLSEKQWRMLRQLACRTWRYFAVFQDEQNNWLIPDNFQEVPDPMVATRTSPTNLSLFLTSCLAAWDFGYLTTEQCVERVERALDSMEKLEQYRGHFYNWYDTNGLQPLEPRYISSVDSGNLAAGLLTLRSGLAEMREQPLFGEQAWEGLRDTLAVLENESRQGDVVEVRHLFQEAKMLLLSAPAESAERHERLKELCDKARNIRICAESARLAPFMAWAEIFVELCQAHATAAEKLAETADSGMTLRQLARSAHDQEKPSGISVHAARLERKIEDLAERCHHMQTTMDFTFLYNRERELLHIGFDVDARRLDPSYYDLLASEARIASFLMIASEQAPPSHWFALGRLLIGRGRHATLASWSGSMFEYLMPCLYMTSYPQTLLTRTIHTMIKRQISYGHQRQIPWGMSESCYNATDARHVYQYRAFGVPGLGLKRGLSNDLVVAPYATLLALPFAPLAACANLERLIHREEALGEYGLIEAIDYTPSRIPPDKSRAPVRSYMAHHQGMGLMALANFLRDSSMIRRFMADPFVKATEMLLQERVPDISPVVHPHQREALSAPAATSGESGESTRVFQDPNIEVPAVHLLSNGEYHLMLTHAGGSVSRWKNVALTRWREDFTRDCWGTFVYLRDVENGKVWSNTYHPLVEACDREMAIFSQGRAEFKRRNFEIATRTEVCVSPEDDVEIRRITLTNHGRRDRSLELISYAEVVLAPDTADMAHRAFSSLFVHTEILPDGETVVCTRRARSPEEPEVWAFWQLHVHGQRHIATCETDRARFIGRTRTTSNPVALEVPGGQAITLGNTQGFVLDPVAAVCQPCRLTADEPVQAVLTCGVAATREAVVELAGKYRDRHFVERAFDMSWSHSQIIRRLLNITHVEAQVYERLAASMVFANPRNRAPWAVIKRNTQGQQGLWRFGISGDLPLILLRISDLRHIQLVTDVLRAHAFWRMKGVNSDLVILNEDFSGYRATLNDRIISALNTSPDADMVDRPGGVFLRRIENLSEDDLLLFQSVARVILTDGTETLLEQVERRYVPHRSPALLKPTLPRATSLESRESLQHRDLILSNDMGGFTNDGREYIIMMEPGQKTPAPWSNVIAGKRLGMVVSESGGIYTWVDNAHEYRLTSWYNDPVSDASGEAFYLRDEETGTFWSLSPLPAPDGSGYVCRHGFGYTVFEHQAEGLDTELWFYAALEDPVRCAVIKVTNTTTTRRRISLTAFHELVMGEWRHDNMMHIFTETDSHSGQLVAYNPYSRVYPKRVLFATCSEPEMVLCGDRAEFIGRNGSLSAPTALLRERLSGRTGSRYDPAAAIQSFVTLAPGETREVVFTLGAADDTDHMRALYREYGGPAGARSALEAVWEHWNRRLGALQVDVPGNPALNVLANGWLLYQTLSCRLWGRSGYYQSSGAYGFRDQLQDAMAMLHAAPEVLRQQILFSAAHQFPEGDTLHWWHPPTGAGVRTRIVDDRLWLPQAVARYVGATGDTNVLDEQVPFIEGRKVDEGEESRYEHYPQSQRTASLYEHCLRALRVSMEFGAHGLPLMGSGDWNDGMNRVGIKGRGESVWMAWFLGDTLRRFAGVAEARHDHETLSWCQQEREKIRGAVEASAWDGKWYRRAYYDDGTPLGTHTDNEGRIDAISQSWSVISRMGGKARATQAMAAVKEHLVREDERIVLLLTPPFDKTPRNPGYIKSYPPGIRENGAQYSHAAIWTAIAFAELGDHETAWELLELLNPVNHSRTPEEAALYKVEPYVMSADIYSVPPHVGRGGWSWYTGAAGWMYRLITETLLGVRRFPGHLEIKPRLPRKLRDGYTLRYRYGATEYQIEVRTVEDRAEERVIVDNVLQEDGRIPLHDDGRQRQVRVFIAEAPSELSRAMSE